MKDILNVMIDFLISNAFVASFIIVGILSLVADLLSKKVLKGRIAASAIAIFLGLILAYIAGVVLANPENAGLAKDGVTEYKKGLADIAIFSGVGFLGSSMFRDFTIVSTAFGAKISELKKCGLVAIIALFFGIVSSFVVGGAVAYAFGYHNPVDIATIGAGTVTFVVGPVTGEALGASSEVITLSIAAGVIKSVAVMILTPICAKFVGLNTPRAAMIFGGLMGTTSGTSAGLAATDPALVPYGAMTATFYTGLGCLLCPSVLYGLTELIL